MKSRPMGRGLALYMLAAGAAIALAVVVFLMVYGGAAERHAVLVSAATASYDDTAVTGGTTYTYTVIATFQNWVSAPAAVTVTTAARC